MKPTHILLVEDDPVLNEQLTNLLSKNGYKVANSFDGEKGLAMAMSEQYQLMILDVMLPKLDGFALLNLLRKNSQMPVIVLSAKGAEEERIAGLSCGADDYLAKPFNSTELLLRIEALLRRSQPEQDNTRNNRLVLDGLIMETANQQIYVNDTELVLTTIQFGLLRELLANRGEVLSKAYLSQRVLNRAHGAHDRSIDMHLSRVRRKLKETGWQGDRLQTVHGKGYRIL